MAAQLHQRVVGYGNNTLPRIAIRLAEGVELLEIDFTQAGLLLKFAQSSVFQRLLHVDESTGNASVPRKARCRAG